VAGDDDAHQGEPDAGPGEAARGAAAGQFLPHLPDLVRGDARSGVGHLEQQPLVVLAGAHLHRVTGAGELHRVGDQVLDGDEQQVPVAFDVRQGPWRLGYRQPQDPLARAGDLGGRLGHLVQQAGQVDRRRLDLLGLQVGQLAQVAHQARDPVRLRGHADQGSRPAVGSPGAGRRARLLDVRQPRAHGGQRVLQLMVEPHEEAQPVLRGRGRGLLHRRRGGDDGPSAHHDHDGQDAGAEQPGEPGQQAGRHHRVEPGRGLGRLERGTQRRPRGQGNEQPPYRAPQQPRHRTSSTLATNR
jgi:hypothetical protein